MKGGLGRLVMPPPVTAGGAVLLHDGGRVASAGHDGVGVGDAAVAAVVDQEEDGVSRLALGGDNAGGAGKLFNHGNRVVELLPDQVVLGQAVKADTNLER